MRATRISNLPLFLNLNSERINGIAVYLNRHDLIVEQSSECANRWEQSVGELNQSLIVRFCIRALKKELCRWDIANRVALKSLSLEFDVAEQTFNQRNIRLLRAKALYKGARRLENVGKKSHEDIAAATLFAVGNPCWDIHGGGAHNCGYQHLGPSTGVEWLDARGATVLIENPPREQSAQNKSGGTGGTQVPFCNSLHSYPVDSPERERILPGKSRGGGSC